MLAVFILVIAFDCYFNFQKRAAWNDYEMYCILNHDNL